MPAVMQLLSLLVDYRLSLEDAFHQPRIDVSVPGQPTVDPLLDAAVRTAVAGRFPQTVEHSRGPYPLTLDRKSVVSGKSVSVRVDLGGRRILKKKNIDDKSQ